MPRFLALVLPMLVLLLFSPGASAASGSQALVDEINSSRTARGLPPVKLSSRLSRVCRSYARTMIKRGRWAHARRIRVKGFRGVGEILARSTGPLSATGLVKAWLGSEVHRKVLLGSRHRYVGIGTRSGRMGGKKTRVWVVRLAR
jgi:uncharacterized protein YkwD